ncbi:MAG TPA: DUF3307 domain-containing protein [Acetobacteraceae bacterium]|nr:DUF3307 domain-containing protein [Acetobacteraceae bacterium]
MPILFRASAPVWTALALTGAMALKHYLADFLLQGSWMARGKERSRGWVGPLLAHAGCHAMLTLGIALMVAPRLWWLATVDFTIHAAIDRVKTLVAHWGGWAPAQPRFWWLLGLDQFLHNLTGLGLVLALLAL